ncbi:hypothetical protein [Arcobacter peruensis]|uniref:hypothetical protein n=1 Tax=Arcobacter peruensis TaxID=2320140 RepID=UPI000F07CF9A|nr:hypothetical protein [Arcobacter peruensis]
MTKETIEHIKKILIYSGYEDELKDILFIEDLEDFEVEGLEDLHDLDLEDFEIEPIEFEELY